ncbi:hypothetical protein J41TS12_17590 [Paenibacillus antibioticophila]|uniref:Uncharacterized protein n=1 Tax=Paenibacillus antibioticophila TaxID=1274374 RepID=A0A920CGK4_9BACL|nr:hypothetical protein J41TS12_17590 [Paenibacillus antibioticophila]
MNDDAYSEAWKVLRGEGLTITVSNVPSDLARKLCGESIRGDDRSGKENDSSRDPHQHTGHETDLC